MILNKRLKPFTAIAPFAALALSTLAAGSSAVKDAKSAACCDGFKDGTTMTTASFPSVDASIQGSFVAFANAASDLSAVATGSISDVTTACQNNALDLGADPTDPSRPTIGHGPDQAGAPGQGLNQRELRRKRLARR